MLGFASALRNARSRLGVVVASLPPSPTSPSLLSSGCYRGKLAIIITFIIIEPCATLGPRWALSSLRSVIAHLGGPDERCIRYTPSSPTSPSLLSSGCYRGKLAIIDYFHCY